MCCVIETLWTVLAQVLAPPTLPPASSSSTKAELGGVSANIEEAAAANKAWLSLMRNAAIDSVDVPEETIPILKATIEYAMQCFTDLLVQIEEMDSEPSIDTYAWETMSESLVSYPIFIKSSSHQIRVVLRN